MSRTEIVDKLREVFTMIMGDDKSSLELDEQSRLIEDVGLNSVGILYFVVGIEEMFGIRFENVGIADFANVGSVVDYIEGRLAE